MGRLPFIGAAAVLSAGALCIIAAPAEAGPAVRAARARPAAAFSLRSQTAARSIDAAFRPRSPSLYAAAARPLDMRYPSALPAANRTAAPAAARPAAIMAAGSAKALAVFTAPSASRDEAAIRLASSRLFDNALSRTGHRGASFSNAASLGVQPLARAAAATPPKRTTPPGSDNGGGAGSRESAGRDIVRFGAMGAITAASLAAALPGFWPPVIVAGLAAFTFLMAPYSQSRRMARRRTTLYLSFAVGTLAYAAYAYASGAAALPALASALVSGVAAAWHRHQDSGWARPESQ